MAFIKKHWFSFIVGLLLAVFLLMFILILIAPKQDVQKRGFVACSHQLLADLGECERGLWCSGKAVLRCSWCDIKVIGRGLQNWAKGSQPAPWSNYIYEAEIPQNGFIDEAARQEYLVRFPDTEREMERLNLLRKELENEQNIIENGQDLWPEEDKSAGVGSDRPVSGD